MKNSKQKKEIEKFLENYTYIKLKKNEYEVWGDFDENIFDAPVKIKILHGDLFLSDLKIKSFKNKNLPSVVFGNLKVTNNDNLKNLIGLPKIVLSNFFCQGNDSLISLKGCPKMIGENLYVDNNENLKNLIGLPKIVFGNFFCEANDSLISLKGSPEIVEGDFGICQDMNLKTFKYGPKIVKGWVDAAISGITCVKYLPKFIGRYLMLYGLEKKFKRSEVYKYSHVNETVFVTYQEASYEEEFPEND